METNVVDFSKLTRETAREVTHNQLLPIISAIATELGMFILDREVSKDTPPDSHELKFDRHFILLSHGAPKDRETYYRENTSKGIHISFEHYPKPQFQISGIYPKHSVADKRNSHIADAIITTDYGQQIRRHNENTPSINCGCGKTAKQIAGDIARRFFPEYDVWFHRAMDARIADMKHTDDVESTRAKVLKALGKVGESCRDGDIRLRMGDECGFGTIKPYTNDVSFDLNSLPVDLALKICKVIADYK